MPQKRKPSFTREQLDRFMSGATGAEAMGHTKSPGAGKQGFMAQEVEKLLRKNPEICSTTKLKSFLWVAMSVATPNEGRRTNAYNYDQHFTGWYASRYDGRE